MYETKSKRPPEHIDPTGTSEYKEGDLAFRNGEPETSCPYDSANVGFNARRYRWSCGYYAAQVANRVTSIETTDSAATSVGTTDTV